MKFIAQTNCNLYAQVSHQDYDWLNQFEWFVNENGYAVRSVSKQEKHERGLPDSCSYVFMHREIMQTPAGMMTDHIDGNRLNNTRENLRIVTAQQNARNAKLRKDNKTGAAGVHKNKHNNTYYAQLKVDGKNKTVGAGLEFDEAVQARQEAILEYWR